MLKKCTSVSGVGLIFAALGALSASAKAPERATNLTLVCEGGERPHSELKLDLRHGRLIEFENDGEMYASDVPFHIERDTFWWPATDGRHADWDFVFNRSDWTLRWYFHNMRSYRARVTQYCQKVDPFDF
jgi:hypothetical protein